MGKGPAHGWAKLNVHAELFPEDDKTLKVFKHYRSRDEKLESFKKKKKQEKRKGGREGGKKTKHRIHQNPLVC